MLQVDEAFADSQNVNVSALIMPFRDDPETIAVATELQYNASSGILERLENEDCIIAYGQAYLSSRRNLLLVSASQQANSTSAIYHSEVNNPSSLDLQNVCAPDPVTWMCPDFQCTEPCINRLQELKNDPSAWNPFDRKVDYCLSEVVDQRCQLHFSLPIAVTVIVFNLVKALMMLGLIVGSHEPRIHTVGDAIRTYLTKSDPRTANCCLRTAREFQVKGFPGTPQAKPWKNERRPFSNGARLSRWVWSFFL